MVALTNLRFSRAIALLITTFFLSLPAYAKYSGGTGQPNDPYQIATAEDLILIENNWDYEKHFILIADINFDHVVFDKPVISNFWGVFDGNDHKISNLSIEGKYYLGLFGTLGDGAEIKNLGVINVNIVGSDGSSIGGLAGNSIRNSHVSVSYCYSTGTIIGGTNVGGLIGSVADDTIIYSSYSTSTVSGLRNVGGLVGDNEGKLDLCYSAGEVIGSEAVLITDTFLLGSDAVGGLVGYNDFGTVINCYNTSSVSGYSNVGGLVGENHVGTIRQCYSTGTVDNSNDNIGGLVGTNYMGLVTQCFSSGVVSGSANHVGGLVGENDMLGRVTDCYSTGSVSGDSLVGGLVGYNKGTVIATCYSIGEVSGSDNVGGLVGAGPREGVTACFWDVETSGQFESAGGTGKTTTEMQNINTYLDEGWDFVNEVPNGLEETWWINEGVDYPQLWWYSGQTRYSGGTGKFDDPYQISTVSDLILLGKSIEDYDKHFILTADIDLDPNLYGNIVFDKAIIAAEGTSFSGVFEGNNHKISNMTIESSRYLGLFGQLGSTAIISNLNMEAVDVNGTRSYVGSLVGYNNGDVVACYSSGFVTGNLDVGGLVGKNDGNIIMSNSNNVVNGVGSAIDFVYNTCKRIGGLAGQNSGNIILSYSNGKVSGTYLQVGGLVGSNVGTLMHCYNIASTRGKSKVGGLTGSNSGNVILCYSIGTVTGQEYVGGLVGGNSSDVTNCYSIGEVSGIDNVGGLIGGAGLIASVKACFWDVEASGQIESAGGTGKITTEMQNINTYLDEGWDFVDEVVNGTCDYWQMLPSDYPRFQYSTNNNPVMPEGRGTVEEPYLIRNARDLGTIWFEPMAHYRLETSLDLYDITWSLAVIPWFRGTFDGGEKLISNLKIQGSGYLGLFGKLESGANISGLDLDAIEIEGTGGYIGCLAGENHDSNINMSHCNGTVTGQDYVGGLVGGNSGNVTNCYSIGEVNGSDNVGGLVGKNMSGNINISYSTSSVTGSQFVGGLVGYKFGGNLIQCHSTGEVSGWKRVGGLLGENNDNSLFNLTGTLNQCYSTGTVSGSVIVGGLVGFNDDGNISDCNSSSMVSSENGEVGGLVGFNEGSIASSYSMGKVSGSSYVGGLVGRSSQADITNCYSIGTVTGKERVGGLVGDNNYGSITGSYSTSEVTGSQYTSKYVGGFVGKNDRGTITHCYSTGAVSGWLYIGGFVGENQTNAYSRGTVTHCYSTGAVSGQSYIGGLVGDSQTDSITSSFWDVETSGQTTSDGGTGMTTIEMQTANTFLEVGWDFVGETENGTDDIWWIDEGLDYPRLWWELIPEN